MGGLPSLPPRRRLPGVRERPQLLRTLAIPDMQRRPARVLAVPNVCALVDRGYIRECLARHRVLAAAPETSLTMLNLALLFVVGLATAVGTHDLQLRLERWHYDRHFGD
jgi:hypothetical protein